MRLRHFKSSSLAPRHESLSISCPIGSGWIELSREREHAPRLLPSARRVRGRRRHRGHRRERLSRDRSPPARESPPISRTACSLPMWTRTRPASSRPEIRGDSACRERIFLLLPSPRQVACASTKGITSREVRLIARVGMSGDGGSLTCIFRSGDSIDPTTSAAFPVVCSRSQAGGVHEHHRHRGQGCCKPESSWRPAGETLGMPSRPYDSPRTCCSHDVSGLQPAPKPFSLCSDDPWGPCFRSDAAGGLSLNHGVANAAAARSPSSTSPGSSRSRCRRVGAHTPARQSA